MELLIGVISVCEFIDSANEILVDKTVVNIIDAITLAKIIFLDFIHRSLNLSLNYRKLNSI